ncbi:hypothetical protein ACH429_24080 [Streptomyces pathocidini]|uniref:Secreted protein n=1 Tax=Streptomyces pathocidini TaxID=1650571 RepID=A0ABW7UX36_9ACTN|nr:hypothetical protein [Streptomyces pathocidini]
MSARTHPWTTPPARGSYETRLPWWAIALPSVAFAALLMLLVGPSGAHAATNGAEPGLGLVLERVQEVLRR